VCNTESVNEIICEFMVNVFVDYFLLLLKCLKNGAVRTKCKHGIIPLLVQMKI
jgi:hypothetical protein